MRSTVRFVFLVLLAVGLSFSVEASSDLKVSGFDELVEANSRFDQTWVRPDLDLSFYTSIHIAEVLIHLSKPDVSHASKSDIQLSHEEYQRKLEEALSAAVADELVLRGFDVVQRSNRTSLALRVAIVNLDRRATPGSGAQNETIYHPGNRIYGFVQPRRQDFGIGTLVLDLFDPETGVVQARLGGREYINVMRNLSTDTGARHNLPDIEDWEVINQWTRGKTRDLVRALKKMRFDLDE